MAYASDTEVTASRSKAEIHRLLEGRLCDNVMVGESREQARIIVQFSYDGLPVQVSAKTPSPIEERFKFTGAGRERSEDQALKEWEKECRRLWRVLVLTLKARFEEIDSRLFSPTQAFVSWLMLPDGSTLHEKAAKGEASIRKYLASDKAPKMLMAPEES